MPTLASRAKTFAAYDSTGVMLLQLKGAQYHHSYEPIAADDSLGVALARAAEKLPARVGMVYTIVDPLKAGISESKFPPTMTPKDADQAARHNFDRTAFTKNAPIADAAQVQPSSRGADVHVTVGAMLEDALTDLRSAVERAGGVLVGAYHPAEAIAAALPDASAIVLLSPKWTIATAVAPDTFYVRVEPRTRMEGWMRTTADSLRAMRSQKSSQFARTVAVVGAADVAALDTFAADANVEVVQPFHEHTDTENNLLWYLAYGVARCAANDAPRVPLNFVDVRIIRAMSERSRVTALAVGVAFGIVATLVSQLLFLAMLSGARSGLAADQGENAALVAQLATERGQIANGIGDLGDVKNSIINARQSGSELDNAMALIGNMAIAHAIWSDGKLDVTRGTSAPKLDVASRSMYAFDLFQTALDHAHYDARWTKLTPTRVNDKTTYLTLKVNQ